MSRYYIIILLIISIYCKTAYDRGVSTEKNETEINMCQMTVPEGNSSKCIAVTQELSSYSKENSVFYCCYESYKIKMTDINTCRLIGNTAKDIGDEKRRLKDYYHAHKIDIVCSQGYIKTGFIILLIFLFL